MNIDEISYSLGFTLQRPAHLKAGKGKSSFKPQATVEFRGTTVEGVQVSALAPLALKSLETELEAQMAVAEACDGDVEF